MSCADCSKGRFLPGRPSGTFTEEGAYFVAGRAPSTRAIVLLTDAFGLPLVNCKIIADNLSNSLACDVWVPDIFGGRPLIGMELSPVSSQAGIKFSWWQKLGHVFALLPSLPLLFLHRPTVVDARIDSLLHKLREEKKYNKIGAIGYCFGGSCAIRLGSRGLVDSVVIVHPARCTIHEIKGIKVPASWACAEEDFWFPTSFQHQAEAAFAEREGKGDFVDYEFKYYKGTAHGFAARPDLTIPDVKAGYEGAFEQAVEWFKKTLPV